MWLQVSYRMFPLEATTAHCPRHGNQTWRGTTGTVHLQWVIMKTSHYNLILVIHNHKMRPSHQWLQIPQDGQPACHWAGRWRHVDLSTTICPSRSRFTPLGPRRLSVLILVLNLPAGERMLSQRYCLPQWCLHLCPLPHLWALKLPRLSALGPRSGTWTGPHWIKLATLVVAVYYHYAAAASWRPTWELVISSIFLPQLPRSSRLSCLPPTLYLELGLHIATWCSRECTQGSRTLNARKHAA